jgi:hypothetical protein
MLRVNTRVETQGDRTGGEERLNRDIGGHVLRETTSRGLSGLVCPSRTSERGGEGDCVKEGGGGEGKSRGSVHCSGYYYATSLDIEVDPQRCRLGSRKSDFALQTLVECRALEPK